MFCYQCQEAAQNKGCTIKGVCGKTNETANLQDLLIFSLKGLAYWSENLLAYADFPLNNGRFACEALFSTITNANFDDARIIDLIKKTLDLRNQTKARFLEAHKKNQHQNFSPEFHDAATWQPANDEDLIGKAALVSIIKTSNEDVRSLRELLIYGLKGIAAYTDHAAVLGHENPEIYRFVYQALASTLKDLNTNEMVNLVLKAGEMAVAAMALLDRANTTAYGHPEITTVNLGVGKNPGILISGHDLKDMQALLEQTQGQGVDVYTHSEMLPANYYPAFKKYSHFIGNYGNAWWKQSTEFESFNGPILMTTNCITPVKDSYKNRLFTTGCAGYPGCRHIEVLENGCKDFSEIIALAKTCPPPTEIETGSLVGGFAHHQVMQLADKVVDAVKTGKIKKFVVMAGCDGRHKSRDYFTDIAQALPADTVILTAGCAKYRYNKLNLGDINGIPRVLDAGQCNDSYSLAIIALKLKEVFQLQDINELPIAFDIAWYEQKAVAVLLALLYLGFKKIRLGPTIPAFLSPKVIDVLVENFQIQGIGTVEEDIVKITQ
jgi:hydroxylamine reductase